MNALTLHPAFERVVKASFDILKSDCETGYHDSVEHWIAKLRSDPQNFTDDEVGLPNTWILCVITHLA